MKPRPARLAVMQPINLSSGEDPILDLDRCAALSRLGQMIQGDHCIAQRLVINQYVVVYERRWLARIYINFSFVVAHVLAPIVMAPIESFESECLEKIIMKISAPKFCPRALVGSLLFSDGFD
jgi:hypothetical protein